jgi:hypothetical protein
MKKAILIFLMLISCGAVFAQFNEAIGTYKAQTGHSVQRSKFDPGYIVAGTDAHIVFGATEATLAKTTLAGALQWSIAYGGVGADTFNCVRQIDSHRSLPVDGYAALGSTTSFSSDEDVYFVRTDATGTPLFSFTFGGREGADRGRCLQYIRNPSTGEFGYVIAGQTDSYPYYGNSIDILIIKTDEDGNLVRAKVIGTPGDDIAYWVEQTIDGGFVLTGTTTIRPGDIYALDFFVIRLDSDLKIIWQNIFKHCTFPGEDAARSVIENPLDGSLTVTGFTRSFGIELSRDVFLLNLNAAGAVNWMKTYGTKNNESGRSIDLSSGGREYIVTGEASNGSGQTDALVFKTDMAGNVLWSNLYGSASSPLEGGQEITNNGLDGYVFAGTAEADYTIDRDFYLVNLSHDGESDGCQREFSKDAIPQTPCISAGFQDVKVSNMRMVCTQHARIDYQVHVCATGAPSVGTLQESQSETTDGFSIVPNPASSAVQIVFQDISIPKNGGTVVIYNRNGKLVQRIPVTSGDIQVPLHGLPDDIYVIHFITKDGKQYQKRFIKK